MTLDNAQPEEDGRALSAHPKHSKAPLVKPFDLPRILSDYALERIAREEAEESAYLRVWEVPGQRNSGAS